MTLMMMMITMMLLMKILADEAVPYKNTMWSLPAFFFFFGALASFIRTKLFKTRERQTLRFPVVGLKIRFLSLKECFLPEKD